MENKVMKFYSKAGSNIILRAIPGHFATSHSHINYYVDQGMNIKEALKAAAKDRGVSKSELYKYTIKEKPKN